MERPQVRLAIGHARLDTPGSMSIKNKDSSFRIRKEPCLTRTYKNSSTLSIFVKSLNCLLITSPQSRQDNLLHTGLLNDYSQQILTRRYDLQDWPPELLKMPQCKHETSLIKNKVYLKSVSVDTPLNRNSIQF
jgi:hypothetical protein